MELTENSRLCYSPDDKILMVQCLRSIHEMPLTDLRDHLCSTVYNLPYNKYTLHAKVKMNLPFQSLKDGYMVTSNLSLFLASLADPKTPKISILVECIFSQD